MVGFSVSDLTQKAAIAIGNQAQDPGGVFWLSLNTLQ